MPRSQPRRFGPGRVSYIYIYIYIYTLPLYRRFIYYLKGCLEISTMFTIPYHMRTENSNSIFYWYYKLPIGPRFLYAIYLAARFYLPPYLRIFSYSIANRIPVPLT